MNEDFRNIRLFYSKVAGCKEWNDGVHDCKELECPKADIWGLTLDGHTVIDIDSFELISFMEPLVLEALSKTLVVVTPRPRYAKSDILKNQQPKLGVHIYLKGEIKSKALPGEVDIKSGKGHYVVAPGTKTQASGEYMAISESKSLDNLVDVNSGFATKLFDKIIEYSNTNYSAGYINSTSGDMYDERQGYLGVDEGRNNFFFNLASKLRVIGLPDDMIENICWDIYNDDRIFSRDGFETRELKTILHRSAEKRKKFIKDNPDLPRKRLQAGAMS